MDLESLETQTLLNKRTPKHQSFALKLAVLLCGLGLFVGVAVPSTNRGDLQGKATLKEKEVTAAAGVSSTSRPASTMSMDWRAAAVAAPAWSTEAPAEDDSHDDTSRTPFGVACRGGGFRQMTMAMGIARGIGAENWPKVTHLGGTSGGYWFASQFTYSKEFYDNVLNESKPLDGVLAHWGEDFAQVQLAAVSTGAAWTKWPGWDQTLPDVCKPLVGVMGLLFGTLGKLSLPIVRWMAYVGNMMAPAIEDIGTAKFGSRAATGLQTATLVGQVAVPPQAYLQGAGRLATRDTSAYSGVSDPELVAQALLPAAFVAPAGDPNSSHWAFNGKVGPMTARVDGEPEAPAILQDNPYLLEVIGASSSNGGWAAVPSMVDARVDSLDINPLLKRLAKSCKPFGVETFASPSLPADYDTPLDSYTQEGLDVVGDAAIYRFVDGGWLENQAAAATLAEMQKGFVGTGWNGIMKLLLVTNSNYSTTPLFAGGPEKYGPFIPANTIAVRNEGGGYYVPGQQIFAEAYPGGEGREARWPVYATAPFPTNLERVLDKGPPPRAEFVASAEYEDVNSTYWRGLVTSVENEWYGTQAGSVVDVLILQSNYPSDIVKTVVEADNANWFFTNVYGPLAASQAAGAAPIIKAWLAGEELPATFP